MHLRKIDFKKFLRAPLFLTILTLVLVIIYYYFFAVLNYGINKTVGWYWDITNINEIVKWFWSLFPLGYGLLVYLRRNTHATLSFLQMTGILFQILSVSLFRFPQEYIFSIHCISVVIFFLNIHWSLRNGKILSK